MKFHRKIIETVDVKYLGINLPVRYGDEDIPYDAPRRHGDTWEAFIDIDAGTVLDWPQGKTLDMYMKVTDSGVYTLYTDEFKEVVSRQDYVPHGLVPGEWGDYVHLKIDATGKITNWPTKISLADFEEDDHD
jgi:hypothetical protein